MSYGEMFLLVWALGGTAVAVISRHRINIYERRSMIAEMMLIGFIEGTARMIKEQDGARFVNVAEDGEDEIFFRRRT
jgi:hypothetical protein